MGNNDQVTLTSDHSDHDTSQDDLDLDRVNGAGDTEDQQSQDEVQEGDHSLDHQNQEGT